VCGSYLRVFVDGFFLLSRVLFWPEASGGLSLGGDRGDRGRRRPCSLFISVLERVVDFVGVFVVWRGAVFFFFFLGLGSALSGFLVVFLRHQVVGGGLFLGGLGGGGGGVLGWVFVGWSRGVFF